MAKGLGRTKGNVSLWELGEHEPSFEQIKAISEITGYPMPGTSPSWPFKTITPAEIAELQFKQRARVERAIRGLLDDADLLDVSTGFGELTESDRRTVRTVIRALTQR